MIAGKTGRGLIFISAGEPSGDLNASLLVRELKRLDPGLRFLGFGGDYMKEQGVKLLRHCNEYSFMGFVEVVKHLPRIRALLKELTSRIQEERPDAVILVDYPGFHLRLIKRIAGFQIPIFYYISPQLWAWNPGRVRLIKSYVREMLCIFPFEQEWYRQHGVNAVYVGHPLVDNIAPKLSQQEFEQQIKRIKHHPLIGLLPGSRQQEVDRHLEIMIQALAILAEKETFQVVIARAPGVNLSNHNFQKPGLMVQVVTDLTHEVQHYSDLIITSSGTATMETALADTPMVVIYRVNPISFLVGRALVRVKQIAMANIIAGGDLIPELIQNKATPERIAREVRRLLYSRKVYQEQRRYLKKVREKLGYRNAPEIAARLILQEIYG